MIEPTPTLKPVGQDEVEMQQIEEGQDDDVVRDVEDIEQVVEKR